MASGRKRTHIRIQEDSEGEIYTPGVIARRVTSVEEGRVVSMKDTSVSKQKKGIKLVHHPGGKGDEATVEQPRNSSEKSKITKRHFVRSKKALKIKREKAKKEFIQRSRKIHQGLCDTLQKFRKEDEESKLRECKKIEASKEKLRLSGRDKYCVDLSDFEPDYEDV